MAGRLATPKPVRGGDAAADFLGESEGFACRLEGGLHALGEAILEEGDELHDWLLFQGVPDKEKKP